MQENPIDNSNKKSLLNWFEAHKVISVCLTMLIIWGSLLAYLYFKADEVTRDPCSICAEKMGKQVVCTIGGIAPVTRVYNVNKSIEDIIPKVNLTIPSKPINTSVFVFPNSS